MNPSNPATLHIYGHSDCLVSTIAEELKGQNAAELTRTVVVLPTRRLRTLTLAKLGKIYGAFLPPNIVSLDQFLELGQGGVSESSLENTSYKDFIELFISNRADPKIPVFAAAELSALFHEIDELGLGEEGFTQLKKALIELCSSSELELGMIEERLVSAETVYKETTDLLSKNRLMTPASLKIKQKTELLEAFKAGNLPYRRVIVAGFNSLKPYQIKLIDELALYTHVDVFVTASEEQRKSNTPVGKIIEGLTNFKTNDQFKTEPLNAERFAVRRFKNAHDEVYDTLGQVQSLIKQGVPASSIAVLVCNESTYTPLVHTYFSGELPSVNFAVAQSFEKTELGFLTSSLLKFMVEPYKHSRLISVCCQPIVLTAIREQLDEKEKVLLKDKNERFFASFVTNLLSNPGPTENLSALIEKCTPSGVRVILKNLEQTSASFASELLTLREWCEKANLLLYSFGLRESFAEMTKLSEKKRSCPRERSAHKGLIAALRYYENLGDLFPYKVSIRFFLKKFLKTLSQIDVREIGEPLSGVQVMGVTEARYFPFRHIFFIGASENNLPKPLPKDFFVDDRLKSKAGFASKSQLMALESLTFDSFMNRAAFITLSYSDFEGAKNVGGSQFIEPLLARLQIKSIYPEIAQKQIEEVETEALPLGQYSGDRQKLMSTFSATSLQKLINCPYQYLLTKLGVTSVDDLDELFNMKSRGILFHRIMEEFFNPKINPLFLKTHTPEDFTTLAQEILTEYTIKFAPLGFCETEFYYNLTASLWPETVKFFKRLYENDQGMIEMPHTVFSELRFSSGKNLSHIKPFENLEASNMLKDQSFEIQGSIDHISYRDDLVWVCDFKLGKAPTKSEVAAARAPQLIFYSLAIDELMKSKKIPESTALAYGYWMLHKASHDIILAEEDGESKLRKMKFTNARSKTLSPEDSKEALRNIWHLRAEEILIQNENLKPNKSNCGYCTYTDICRKSDPFSLEHDLIDLNPLEVPSD